PNPLVKRDWPMARLVIVGDNFTLNHVLISTSELVRNAHPTRLRPFCETDTAGKSAHTIVSDYAKQAVLIVPFFMK
ncbi:MAG: hypothetical protein ACRESZ_07640, partial [Methylococcales bacterium]